MTHQEHQVVAGIVVVEFYRCREPAQQRRHRFFFDPIENKLLRWPSDIEHNREVRRVIINARDIQPCHREADIIPHLIQQAHGERQMVRILLILARRCRT